MGFEDQLKKVFAKIGRASTETDGIEQCFVEILETLQYHAQARVACMHAELGDTDFIYCGTEYIDGMESFVQEMHASADFGERGWLSCAEIEKTGLGASSSFCEDCILYPLKDGRSTIGVIALFQVEDPSSELHDLIATTAIPYLTKIYTEKLRQIQAMKDSASVSSQDSVVANTVLSLSSDYQAVIQPIARGIIEDSQISLAAESLRKALRLHSCLIFLIDRIDNLFLLRGISTKATRAEYRRIESLQISNASLESAGYAQSDLHKIDATHIEEYLLAMRDSGSSQSDIVAILDKYRKHKILRIPLFDSFRRLQGFILFVREPNQKQFPHESELSQEIGSRLSDAFEIRNNIYFDYMTGLPNLRRIRPIAVDNLISFEPFCLAICKITNLKDLVIARGDNYVDRCVVVAATKIKKYTRQKIRNAHIGRNSGEAAFTFIIPGVNEERVHSFAQGLVEVISEPIDIDGNPAYLTANIGACLSTDIWDSDMVFNYSKLAIQSISSEKNAYCIFDAEMQQAYQDEIELEDDIKDSMKGRQFLPYYQPKVTCDGEVSGFEALVRWCRNDKIEPPGRFVDKVEKMGLIQGLFEIVFDKVCTDVSTGENLPSVSVNISPSQLANRELIDSIRSQLLTYRVDPKRITLEFVETAIVNSEYFDTIEELKALGFKLSVDDFGTGFARYKTLIDLFNQGLIDELKIDKVFVDDIESTANQNFIRSIAYLAHEFGIQIVIEGVETMEQFNLIKSIDSDFIIQGWLVSRALPVESLHQFDEKDVQRMLKTD